MRWFDRSHLRSHLSRIEERKIEQAETEILRHISYVKLEHMYQRNLRQPVCRLPVEMLVLCLSFLTAKDQLSTIRACRHLRPRATEAPSLWTYVDQIYHPTALTFVLERAQNSAVDIIDLRITDPNDSGLLEVAKSHILNFHLGFRFRIDSRDFATPTPLLERLSFNNTSSDLGYMTDVPSASLYPKLYCLQLNEIDFQGITYSTFQPIKTLRTFSLARKSGLITDYLAFISGQLPNITTINLQLAKWAAMGADTPAPALRRVNIRWTVPEVFSPADVIPYPEAWNTVQTAHVTHVGNSLSGNFPIPAETVPYRHLWSEPLFQEASKCIFASSTRMAASVSFAASILRLSPA